MPGTFFPERLSRRMMGWLRVPMRGLVQKWAGAGDTGAAVCVRVCARNAIH
jgi:hypothetical protein